MESIPFPLPEFKKIKNRYHTSLEGTFRVFDAAIKISGAGFSFSNASADTMASNLKNNKVHG